MSREFEIDDLLYRKLEAEAEKRGQTPNQLLCLLLDRGLADLKPHPAHRFTVKARPLHALPGVDFSSTSRLLESLDEERYSG